MVFCKCFFKLLIVIWTHLRLKLPSFVPEISLTWTLIQLLRSYKVVLLFAWKTKFESMYSLIKGCSIFSSKFFVFSILKGLQLLSNFPYSESFKTVDSAIAATFDCFWVPQPFFNLLQTLCLVDFPTLSSSYLIISSSL